jgi:hypothetical protein
VGHTSLSEVETTKLKAFNAKIVVDENQILVPPMVILL